MNTDSPGSIEPGCLYLVEEARRRLKIGEWAWRQMRRAGLPVIRQGNRAYVYADDLIAHMRRASQQGASE